MGNSEKEELKSTNPIRIVLADDHALVLAGIRALLERIRGVEVLAEAGDGQEALRLIKELHPDIILAGHCHAGPKWTGRAARNNGQFSGVAGHYSYRS